MKKMKEINETKKHVERAAPRLLQTHELRRVDGGGDKLGPSPSWGVWPPSW